VTSGGRAGDPAPRPLPEVGADPGPSDLLQREEGTFREAGAPDVARGMVFVFAAGGLRHLHRASGEFLGYPPGRTFWRDALDLIHDDDLPRVRSAISEVSDNPGTSLSTGARFLDASGIWHLMDVTVLNVLEAPGDGGLVVVNVREAPHTDETRLP
jgi:PAS fold